MFTLQPNASHTTSIDANVVEVQSCEQGLGAHIRATDKGLYTGGLQYGFTWPLYNGWLVTLLPRVGLSYITHNVPELPLRGQFELGVQALLGREHWRVGIEYMHYSNAGLREPNIGMDFAGVVVGGVFQ